MIKRILVYCLVVVLAFLISYFSNTYLLFLNYLTTSYNLFSVYLFNAIASIVVYLLLELVTEQLPTQVGFAYLTLIFVKLGLFILIFSSAIFAEVPLAKFERISLLIPVFLYLMLEAVASFKLLNKD